MQFNLTSFLSCFINCLIPIRDRFVFGITSSKASKTRASGFHIEEYNVATVVVINRRRDSFFLYSEMLFLCHSGCSLSNELIPPGIILAEDPSPNHSS